MQRVVRSALLAALTIAGLTACGDKVNVVGPSTSGVNGVTVTPPSATMQVGDKVQFAASVNAPSGVSRAVTWTSSNTAVVTVDQTGLATGVAVGSASIVAKSVADPTQSGAAAVTVGGGAQPTITVSTINQTTCQPNGVCNSVPANLQNVQGQIDVTFNVDPGSQKLAEVDLIMNCTGPGNSGTDTVVARQTVSSSSIAAEAATAPITLSFNTASFNSTNGAVAFKNGSCTIKGKAVTTSGTQTNNTVSATQALVLNNTDFIVISPAITTTPTAPQLQTATDANGLLWNAGAVNVTAVPVIFSNTTITSGTITLVNGSATTQLGQASAPVGAGGTVATSPSLTPSGGLLTFAFPNSTSAAGGVGGATVDTLIVRVATINSQGTNGPTLTTTATPGNFIRLDNLAPPQVSGIVVNFISQNATNNWVGANFAFTKAAGFIVSIPAATTADNGGVDKITETPQFSTAAAPTTWTNITTTAAIGESSSATAFNFRFNVCDALMNCAAAPPTSATGDQFGVDVTPPRITNVQGPQNLEIVGIGQAFANGNNLSGTLTDSSGTGSSVTGSGFSATPLLVAETQLVPSGASGQVSTCVIGTPGPADGNGNTACKAASLEPNGVNVVPTIPGMYTVTYQAIDQAGNTSPAVTIMFYDDKTAPAVSNANITIPGTIAQNTPFSATATDNMDVAGANGRLFYPTLGIGFFEPGGANPAGVPFDNTLTRSSTVTVTLNTFFQSLAFFNGAAIVGSGKPNHIGMRALDAANNLSTEQVVVIPPQNVAGTGATPYTLGTGNNNSLQAMSLQASPTTVSAGGATAGDATSTTLTAVITAANQQVNTPFTSVCFFYQNHTGTEGGLANAVNGGASGDIVLIGCTTTPPADVTTGTVRTFTYQMPWTPGAKFPTGPVNTVAIGINAATDGLIGLTAVVTIVP